MAIALDHDLESLKLKIKTILMRHEYGCSEIQLEREFRQEYGAHIPIENYGCWRVSEFMMDSRLEDIFVTISQKNSHKFFAIEYIQNSTLNSGKKVGFTQNKSETKINKTYSRMPKFVKNIELEKETVQNLEEIIETRCQQPVCLSSIISFYEEHTKKSLLLPKLGYSDLSTFLTDKLNNKMRIFDGDLEMMLISKNSTFEILSYSFTKNDKKEDELKKNDTVPSKKLENIKHSNINLVTCTSFVVCTSFLFLV